MAEQLSHIEELSKRIDSARRASTLKVLIGLGLAVLILFGGILLVSQQMDALREKVFSMSSLGDTIPRIVTRAEALYQYTHLVESKRQFQIDVLHHVLAHLDQKEFDQAAPTSRNWRLTGTLDPAYWPCVIESAQDDTGAAIVCTVPRIEPSGMVVPDKTYRIDLQSKEEIRDSFRQDTIEAFRSEIMKAIHYLNTDMKSIREEKNRRRRELMKPVRRYAESRDEALFYFEVGNRALLFLFLVFVEFVLLRIISRELRFLNELTGHELRFASVELASKPAAHGDKDIMEQPEKDRPLPVEVSKIASQMLAEYGGKPG